ncbi:hypothetical protein G5V57_05310 [Nordella sp. HKS 07]|uniref:hypothetical protein n=1 Tax=Nordella sp. HKS 07 TaxID=2712222 RepID=UPI0013E20587|nr:hypothetical protein [Nordella sp. HKS 07]QIG47202.1 hypothetical protein G5V57_05310 [Nordella sp. HKS 07]
MTTLVFVHGTGVRRKAYDAALKEVQEALAGHERITLAECYWGDLGSVLNKKGASIPEYDTTRAVADIGAADYATDEDYLIALWGKLYDDPLYELRLLSLRKSTDGEFSPGELPPGAQLAQRGREFQLTPDLRSKLAQGGIDQTFETARTAVTGTDVYQDALAAAPAGLAEHRGAIARALIAQSIVETQQQDGVPRIASDASLRDVVEKLLIEELGGQEMGVVGDWLKRQLGGQAASVASWYVQRKRGAITDSAYPAAGDILLYQACGKTIRERIEERVQGASAPRVLLAHSLGGIASVDLLVEKPCGIDLLVTVGSQAPFLYEIGALRSLAFGSPLPSHFPKKWLNIYDPRDFLSYVAECIFPGQVEDHKVNNRQSFPYSHSAYWTNPEVWAKIMDVLP